jgi:hypothetical protein
MARKWGTSPDRLDAALAARGLTGDDDIAEAARHVFVYDRTSAGPVRPERLADCFHLDDEDGGV